jgi:hypothetical protein
MTALRLTAFLDYAEDDFETGADFWSAVTGWSRSPQRGDQAEFTSLLPPEGSDYLRVQRLGQGGARVHVDVHVEGLEEAVAEAERLGATALDRPYDEVVTMRSPGGLVFCLVTGEGGERPDPARWPDGRRSYVDQVCLDIPPSDYDDEMEFWAALTGWRRRDPRPGSEFGRLTPGPDQPLQLLLQRLDDEQESVTAHLDWAASDHDAEVAAHEAAGARVQGRLEGWTVLEDPVGMTYCITRRRPGDRPE